MNSRRSIPPFNIRSSHLIVSVLLLTFAIATATTSLESCREAGFDPYQLACNTCDLLPVIHQEKCRSCCVSYKTVDKAYRRYRAAILLYTGQAASYYPELNSMVTEDWTELVDQKGSDRLVLKDISGMPLYPCILWFQEDLPPNSKSMKVQELERLASDRVELRGWKRDDLREMIKAIVQDP